MSEQKITIPDIGDFSKVPVIELCVKVGEIVKKDQSLVTLETEKATMDIPSPYAGTITHLSLKVGDTVSRGDAICTIESSAAEDVVSTEPSPTAIPASTPSSEPPVLPPAPVVPVSPPPVAALAAPTDRQSAVYAGPATRRLAYQLGVTLEGIVGTGHNGRITTEDLHQYVKKKLAEGSGLGLAIAKAPEIDFKKFGPIEEHPLSRIKKLTASNLHRNWVTIPHVTQFDEADITELENFRKAQQPFAEKANTKLTVLVFVMKAVVHSLKAYPQFNASLSSDGQSLIYKRYYHLGVAVDTPNGLVVPIVRDVDQKGVLQLALELGNLSARARAGTLTLQEMQGSSFSISSLGGVGGTAFTPIINAPDVAILGLSKMSYKPVYQQQQFVPRLMLPLSLSYDHRVIDGAEAARFMHHLSQHLNDMRTLLL